MTPDIEFFNFPHDFVENDNFFRQLAIDASAESDNQRPIHFYGCYPDSNFLTKILIFIKSRMSNKGMTKWLDFQQGIVEPRDKHAFNVWCTFENRRPPVHGYDLSFSFDLDSYRDTNFYLPLILLYLRINTGASKHPITLAETQMKRKLSEKEINAKIGFVSSFINNPHPMRLRAIKELNELEPVAIFGRSVDHYVTDKLDEAKKYWFNLCFENDLYPGYVTEKVLEAWLSKSVPLYWGDDAAGILNKKAYINLRDFPSLEDFSSYIAEIILDEKKLLEIIEQPLFGKCPEYSDILKFFIKRLEA